MKIDFDMLKTMASAGATADVLIAYLEKQHGKGEKKRSRDRKWARDRKPIEGEKAPKADDSAPKHIELERAYFARANEICGGRAGAIASALLRIKGQDVGAADAVLDAAMKTRDPRAYVAAACKENANGNRAYPPGSGTTHADAILAGMAKVAARRGASARAAATPEHEGELFGSPGTAESPAAEPDPTCRD